jgi:hypothetical protein
VNARLLSALAAVVLLGGGSVAFVLLRDAREREARIAGLVAEVDAELSGAQPPDAELLRNLLQRLRPAVEQTADPRLEIAEGRLLLALGRTQQAWESIRPLATAPGAEASALELGSRVLARIHAETGEDPIGRQALAMANEHARQVGSAESLRLAWQLAYRVGEAERFAALSEEIVADGREPEDELVRATARVLGGFLADRLGVDRTAVRPGAAGVAGDLAVVEGLAGEAPTVEALDELLLRFAEPPPEIEIVAVTRLLEEFGALEGDAARSGRAENLLRDARRRIDTVLARTPTNVDARHLAVVAGIGMQQSFGLDEDAARSYRGHLQWLVTSAPPRHAQRALWQALLDQLPR